MDRTQESGVSTNWERVGECQFRAELEGPDGDRRIEREYFVCQDKVVEVDKLFKAGRPVAVFRSLVGPHALGTEVGQDEDLEEPLKELAFEGSDLQLIEEFNVSVEVFEDRPFEEE